MMAFLATLAACGICALIGFIAGGLFMAVRNQREQHYRRVVELMQLDPRFGPVIKLGDIDESRTLH